MKKIDLKNEPDVLNFMIPFMGYSGKRWKSHFLKWLCYLYLIKICFIACSSTFLDDWSLNLGQYIILGKRIFVTKVRIQRMKSSRTKMHDSNTNGNIWCEERLPLQQCVLCLLSVDHGRSDNCHRSSKLLQCGNTCMGNHVC